MNKHLCSIPHNPQAWFTDAEFDVARIIYANQQRVANRTRDLTLPEYRGEEDCRGAARDQGFI